MRTVRMLLITAVITIFAVTAYADEYQKLGETASKMGVSSSLAEQLMERTRSAGYSGDAVNAVIRSMQNGDAESASRVAEKVLEGIAKNVPEGLVVSAVEKVRSRYEYARGIASQAGVSGVPSEKVRSMVADAMAAGAKGDELAEIAREVAGKTREKNEYAESAFSLYREMVRYGVESNKAKDIVKETVGKYGADEIMQYRSEFMEKAGYMNAEKAAGMMESNVHESREPGSMGGGSGSGGMDGSGGMGGGNPGGSGGGHGGGGRR
ncbi:hypothetical protein [Limisalsivibrio acetivorans]|uniref:hypothetical protein n=1 Tax=Limisalsivibrio acetivorans TaxID=1304888 RepID=UPI0003B6523D|nr:hypothetical protein [Limisalsivibrio acetivorans]